jgi:integrase
LSSPNPLFLNSLTSPSSQRTYDHAIREFIEWYCSEPRLAFNKTVVIRYRISLELQLYASTTINLRLAAVRRLAYEAADCGLLSADLAAGIRRVKGAKRLGVPVGNWLTAEQGKRLLRTVDCSSLRGKRDYATLAILLGCGLRRAELTTLRVEDIQQREDHWVIAAPHDLRRTCARLCHQAGGELEQIQFFLGHVSVQTTERYLGCKQRFRNAVNDRIGLEPDAVGSQ